MDEKSLPLDSDIWKLFTEGRKYTWRADSINLSQEAARFFSETHQHRKLIRNLMALAISDNALFRTIFYDIIKDFKEDEFLACICSEINAVKNHFEMCSRLLQKYFQFAEGKQALFGTITSMESFSEKRIWLNSNSSSAAERVVCYACIKGVFGWSRFIEILNFKDDNIMKESCLLESNNLIIRDIMLHVEFSIRLYRSLDEVLDMQRTKKIIQDAVDIENQLAREILSHLSSEQLEQHGYYIQWCGDQILRKLGFPNETQIPESYRWTIESMPKRELPEDLVNE
ncbi:hypothetical protein LXL04_015747 [Taraxacum kok-saghyz]